MRVVIQTSIGVGMIPWAPSGHAIRLRTLSEYAQPCPEPPPCGAEEHLPRGRPGNPPYNVVVRETRMPAAREEGFPPCSHAPIVAGDVVLHRGPQHALVTMTTTSVRININGSTPLGHARVDSLAGPVHLRYGGNTSCVEVQLSDGHRIVLDAGSGIRPLGAALGPCEATLLLSHYHWDHIQGLPFFTPAYVPSSEVRVFGPEWEGQGPQEYLSEQMTPPFFPAAPSEMRGVRSFHLTPCSPFPVGSAMVRATRLSHPSITYGYRLDENGTSFVYYSDNEVDTAEPRVLANLIELAAGADILLHDCQYTEGEYAIRHHWGHSTPRQAVRVAREAGVRQLVLFHHDPSHSDEQVEALAEEARSLAGPVEIIIAGEGQTLVPGTTVIQTLVPRRRAAVRSLKPAGRSSETGWPAATACLCITSST